MKKVFIFSVLFVLLSFAGSVSAAVTECGDPALSTPSITYVSCGGGDSMRATMPWGMTGYETPQFGVGSTVTDIGGVSSTCPSWLGRNCFDLTKTEYYKQRMRDLVADLVSKNWIGHFPSLAGWVGK